MSEETPKKPATVVMSKKKYNELRDRLTEYVDSNTLDRMLSDIREVLRFNPEDKTYTPEKGKQFMEWRKKHAEKLGITEYEYIYRKKTEMKTT